MLRPVGARSPTLQRAEADESGAVAAGRIIDPHRTTAWRWVQKADERAEQLRALPPGREVGTHTFRRSYARHLLMNGIPMNYPPLSPWLRHSSFQTTLIHLELLPDPTEALRWCRERVKRNLLQSAASKHRHGSGLSSSGISSGGDAPGT